MSKHDIKNILTGIAIVLAGILVCIYFSYRHFSYTDSENHYKVKANPISVDSDYYYEDGDKKWKYFTEWECEIEGQTYTFTTLEYDIRPVGHKTFYLYENSEGKMEVSKNAGIKSLLIGNGLGILGALGGIVGYIIPSIKRTKRNRKNKLSERSKS